MAGLVDAAGRELVSPHMFRHRFADRWKATGGSEEGLMAVGGWSNRDIMARYGRVNRSNRAIEEYRRLRG
jgi:integrase